MQSLVCVSVAVARMCVWGRHSCHRSRLQGKGYGDAVAGMKLDAYMQSLGCSVHVIARIGVLGRYSCYRSRLQGKGYGDAVARMKLDAYRTCNR